ncbi:MAG: hypothetical protein G01um101417_229 [Parcubacteria group bacterium Gr01-1014_17]|nr:MAG: hypothetical protein G01um101417_229 [Parcubacteria group bacterium Gr01-1014_17]
MAKPKQTYMKKVLSFYFAPLWRTFFTTLYLLCFGYFVIFFSDYVILAIRFLYYTFTLPTIALTLDYLFWGASFIVMLVIPFSISLYAIFIPFELMKKLDWTRNQKIAVAFIVALATIDIVVASDIFIRLIEKQPPIVRFLQEIELIK